MSSHTSNQKFTVKAPEFDIENFSFEPINYDPKTQSARASKNQFTTFPRYKYGKEAQVTSTLVIKTTKPIKLTSYGIPRIDGDKVKDDSERGYIKVPYDENQEGCTQLFGVFESIDKFMEENKEQVLGDKAKEANKYSYQPIVREPGEEFNTKGEPNMKYAKLKLATDWDSERSCPGKLKTVLFSTENGTPERIKDIDTVTSLAEYVTWQSSLMFVLQANKIYVAKSSLGGAKTKSYGITFKVTQIVVRERGRTKQGQSQGESYAAYAFSDGEDDEAKEVAAPTVTVTAKPKVAPAKAATSNSSESEASSDSGESDSGSSSESDSDSDDKPAAKGRKPAAKPTKAAKTGK